MYPKKPLNLSFKTHDRYSFVNKISLFTIDADCCENTKNSNEFIDSC